MKKAAPVTQPKTLKQTLPTIYQSLICPDKSGKGWKVKYCTDPEDGLIILWYDGDGGPAVKGPIGEVGRKFKEAMSLLNR